LLFFSFLSFSLSPVDSLSLFSFFFTFHGFFLYQFCFLIVRRTVYIVDIDDEFPTIDIISPLKSPVKSAAVAQDVDKSLKPKYKAKDFHKISSENKTGTFYQVCIHMTTFL
jgi:hypothetical protein